MTLSVLTLTVLATWCVSDGSSVNNKTMELHDEMLTNYNPDIQSSVGTVLTVNLTFHLTSLNDLDEVKGVLGTVGYLMVCWVEDRISWNPLSYAGVTSILVPSEKVSLFLTCRITSTNLITLILNSLATVYDTRSFCGQCRSDSTQYAV